MFIHLFIYLPRSNLIPELKNIFELLLTPSLPTPPLPLTYLTTLTQPIIIVIILLLDVQNLKLDSILIGTLKQKVTT